MDKIRAFLKRKNVVFSAKRYFIDAMSAMAQGLFCTLLVGTILNTIGQQFHIGFLQAVIVTLGKGEGAVGYTVGGLCSAMVGLGMAAAITDPIATCVFRLQMNGAAVSSGMGTCGLVGQIGVYTGWVSDIAAGTKSAITGMDWLGLILISFVLPTVITWLISLPLRKCGWIKENDLKLEL